MIQRSQASATINWLIGSVVFTRHAAVVKRTMVTLCPSRNGTSCGGKWHEGMISFTDGNRDRKVNGHDQILKRFFFPSDSGTITWRSFRNRQYLQMTRDGMTNYQNGNFVYCSQDQNPQLARQIVINQPGRTRQSRDTNGDGLVEDRYGRHLRC